MVAHSAGHANRPRRTFRLKPRGNVDDVAMHVGPVGYHISDVEPDTEAHGLIGVRTLLGGHLLLHRQSAAHGSIDTVKHNKQRIAGSLDDSAAMPIDDRIDRSAAQ